MFDALLFDLDGTLIDTEAVAMTSGRAAFASLGHDVGTGFMHGLIGKDQPTARQIILAELPGADLVALNRIWQDLFRAATETDLPLKPGALALIKAAHGLPMALVTSSGRAEAHRKLAVAGLDAFFAEVITLDDVDNAKPAPDPYLLAALRLGLTPQRCLAFEDSEVGSEAAHRAGCIVVQIPDILPSSGRWAHHVAADLVSGARMAGLVI